MEQHRNERTTHMPHTISLKLASPERIREWSRGEITKPETINYRTGRSERNGLFDERIFGPEKDFECYCKKYRGIKYRGIICEKCGVEITRSVVRRERMGHIELATPVSHIWMLRGIPSRMSLLLDIPVSYLEKVIYFAGYIITNVYESEKKEVLRELEQEYKAKMKVLETEEDKDRLREKYSETKRIIADIKVHKILTELEYHEYSMKFGIVFDAKIGAEAVYEIFRDMDLPGLEALLMKEMEGNDKASRQKLEKRLALVRSLMQSETRPEWMFLKVIPVIPPAIRPMVGLEGGRFATSDINDLYRRVINRNNRLKKLIDIHAPDVILRNEKRILQEAVDALIDNSIKKGSGNTAMSQSQRRQLKSLSDNLKGKQGLFRQNLLGKRVDYSARSVIVVGPTLRLNECGLPKYMALELFRPFVIAKIIERELAFNIRGAGRLIDDGVSEVWEILEEVIEGKYVMLNRAPTLHRLSIQAFKPRLIEGKAIQVHPLVCPAFNADFDGDQMAVHLPLSEEAQQEAEHLIAADKNLLRPMDGKPIVAPSQDIVLGVYWMTKEVEGAKGEGNIYSSPNEAIMAYEYGHVDFRAKIMVLGTSSQRYAEFDGKPFETTVGRLLFNSIFPSDFPYANYAVKKGDLSGLIDSAIDHYGTDMAMPILDKVKAFGFKYVTLSGTTWGISDVIVPEGKQEIVAKGREVDREIEDQFAEGLISDDERRRRVVEIWEGVKVEVEKLIAETLPQSTSLNDMVTSKARGNLSNATMMAGMKGVIVNTKGQAIDFPIIPSYKEGLSPIEYFITTHGSRKGLTDIALNTAKAGYLTRRLVDVAQDVVIREDDCGTKEGFLITERTSEGLIKSMQDQILGRVLAADLKDASGTVLFKKGHLITKDDAAQVKALGVTEALVRSPLTCDSHGGICAKCYGLDLGRNQMVKRGEAVGVVAAQAIGEPGTQLTLRTFHAGGVTGRDITTGLPRVEELFERRSPTSPAVVAERDGEVITVRTDGDKKIIEVLSEADGTKKAQTIEYKVSPRRVVAVTKGDRVEAGDRLTDGSAIIQDVFKHGGLEKAQRYVIEEANKVYDLHGSSIAGKHLEVIIRQMFSRRRITSPGDSEFTTGEIVEMYEFDTVNRTLKERGNTLATAEIIVMGISDVSLTTKSWLSSASFQHTTRTLISNAIKGQQDELRGLKENVIIGTLIPAGTGENADFVPFNIPEVAEEESLEEN